MCELVACTSVLCAVYHVSVWIELSTEVNSRVYACSAWKGWGLATVTVWFLNNAPDVFPEQKLKISVMWYNAEFVVLNHGTHQLCPCLCTYLQLSKKVCVVIAETSPAIYVWSFASHTLQCEYVQRYFSVDVQEVVRVVWESVMWRFNIGVRSSIHQLVTFLPSLHWRNGNPKLVHGSASKIRTYMRELKRYLWRWNKPLLDIFQDGLPWP